MSKTVPVMLQMEESLEGEPLIKLLEVISRIKGVEKITLEMEDISLEDRVNDLSARMREVAAFLGIMTGIGSLDESMIASLMRKIKDKIETLETTVANEKALTALGLRLHKLAGYGETAMKSEIMELRDHVGDMIGRDFRNTPSNVGLVSVSDQPDVGVWVNHPLDVAAVAVLVENVKGIKKARVLE